MSNIPCRVAVCLALLVLGCPTVAVAADEPPEPAEIAGYLLVPHEKVDAKYNAGFSLYVAAWPLLKSYPGQDFQSGLFGTWMFSQYDGPKPEKICTPTSKGDSAGGATRGSPPRRRSSSWAAWP